MKKTNLQLFIADTNEEIRLENEPPDPFQIEALTLDDKEPQQVVPEDAIATEKRCWLLSWAN